MLMYRLRMAPLTETCNEGRRVGGRVLEEEQEQKKGRGRRWEWKKTREKE
jgi:hypothetical protein